MTAYSVLTFCFLAAALCMLQAQGSKNNYLDCCEATKDVPISVRRVNQFKSYVQQDPWMGCPLPAIVLITKAGRGLCYPPDSECALAIVKALDARKKRRGRRS